MSLFKKTCILLFFSLFIHLSLIAQPNQKEWQEDIDFLFKELEISHADLYHTISEDSLKFHVQQLKSKLANLSYYGVVFELEKVLVKINDGHTGLFLPYNRELELQRMPVYLLKLGNELVVANATSEYHHLLGLKLVEINGQSVKKISKPLKEYIIHDNKYGQEHGIPMYIVFNELLAYLGVTVYDQTVTSTFEDIDGEKISESLKLVENESFWDFDEPDSSFADQRWLNTRGRKFWLDVVEDNILYVQLNSSDIGGLEEEMAVMTKDIVRLSSQQDIQKIVLDLRRNAGGSIRHTNPLLESLIAVNTLYPEKPLFVLISSTTFSAANVLAARLEVYTDAVFVGEPTAGRPNGGVGDIGRIIMPNSGIGVRYSQLHGHTVEAWDASPAIFPDLRAPIAYENFIIGNDPAIEAVRKYKEKKDFIDAVSEDIKNGNLKNIIAVYHDYKANRFNEFIIDEQTLNTLGIRVYGKSGVESALPFFKLNAEEYPWYPTAHSNLAEIYMEMGEKEKAMQHYKKAFKLHKGHNKWRERVNKLSE